MDTTKSLFKSKTFWTAAIQALVGAVVVFESAYPSAGALIVMKSVLDITLRLITDTPVSL